jgi:hypothetical protein
VLAFVLGGGRAVAVLLAALPVTGFFALAWWERLRRVASEARAFGRFLEDRELPRRLRRRREELGRELRTLAALETARAGAGA